MDERGGAVSFLKKQLFEKRECFTEISLNNKKALVTGGSGGLGRTISRTLAKCGADVAVHYNSNSNYAEQLVSEIKNTGRNTVAVKADITSYESICKMKQELEASFGMPDILIVNAVIPYWFKRLLEQPPEDYYSQFESCVMQMVYLAKAFIPYMIERNYGRIVAMNTEASMIAQPAYSAYVAVRRTQYNNQSDCSRLDCYRQGTRKGN